MNDKLTQSARIRRSSKFTTDDSGRTVLVDEMETTNLELMSTQMLRQILDTSDLETNDDLRQIAEGESGLLARDIDKGNFEIISDGELEHILKASDAELGATNISSLDDDEMVEPVTDDDELDLVDTQMLRIALNLKDAEEPAADEPLEKRFDPYNNT
jgi:hypothetical protein